MKKHLLAVIFVMLILCASTFAQSSDKSSISLEDSEFRFDQALYLAGLWGDSITFPLGNIPFIKKTLSREEQLLLAIKEFKLQLERYQLNEIYFDDGSIETYIATTYLKLGQELKRQYTDSEYKNFQLDIRAKEYFEFSINNYYESFKKISLGRKYLTATKLVKTVIQAGDLYKALEWIDKLEKVDTPPIYSFGYEILKLKGDIYFIMGQERDAALAYEQWIAKGQIPEYYLNFDPIFNLISSRLIYLK